MEIKVNCRMIVTQIMIFCMLINSYGYCGEKTEPNTPLLDTMNQLEHQLSESKKDIAINIFEKIEKNMAIKISPPDLSLTGTNNYKLCYTVNWDVDKELIKATLEKYFSVKVHPYNYSFNIKERDGKTNFSKPLFDYIMGDPIKIILFWNNGKSLIDVTVSNHTRVPNWEVYPQGSKTYCKSDMSDKEVNTPQEVTAKLVIGAFKGEGTGPIIEWKDIYGREEIGQRNNGGVSLGYSSRGAGTEFSLYGRYSRVKGEYHGGWAKFEEWMISWDFDRVYQFDVKNGDEPGWYSKKGYTWIKE